MSLQAITNFLTVFRPSGATEHRFQNSQVGSNINGHQYLSFIYQGAAKNRTGDNLISGLIMSVNPISMSYAYEAVENKWNVQMDTCLMNDDFTAVQRTLTREVWMASSMSYDASTVEGVLSSSLDAVSLVLPNRVFTTELVGYLPTTASIQSR
ncbi:MAG: hypothetical protein ACR2M9_00380 [Cyanophyceae cyanobacterium]